MVNSVEYGVLKRKVGRPSRYKNLLLSLPEDELFTPAKIAQFAEDSGRIIYYMPDQNHRLSLTEAKTLARQRIRIAMGRLSNNHKFPDEGDGMVTMKGQPPTPGWFGWRWKDVFKIKNKKS